jgi:hypothetical protein
VARAQIADDAAPAKSARLAMPSPEQLGVGAARPAETALDWAATRRTLSDLGAQSFSLDRLPDGGHQFVCMLPTSDAAKPHRVVGRGASEAEAVRRALAEARRWKESR